MKKAGGYCGGPSAATLQNFFYSETEDTAEELPANDNKAEPIQEVELETPIIQTETFCPHCGKRVKVGVVLMAE